jgi:hypothetical protein
MKYVVMKDRTTGEILMLGRFGGKPDHIDEIYLPGSGWQRDNSLYGDLFEGLLEEVSEAEADKIIETQFPKEKQAA